eukprot:274455-Rhodomonas_salina.1
MLLRARYGMSGPYVAYAATRLPMLLPARYLMSGTDGACHVLGTCSYLAARRAVLRWRMAEPGGGGAQ